MKSISKELKVLVILLITLLLQGALFPVLEWVDFVPLVFIPTTLFVGVSNIFSLSRGAIVAFLAGYLTDSFVGSPMSIHTLVAVSIFLMARGAGLRLFFRGPFFQIMLTFLITILAGGAMLALRAIFEPRASLAFMEARAAFGFLFGTSLTTALVSPFLFFMFRQTLGELELESRSESHQLKS